MAAVLLVGCSGSEVDPDPVPVSVLDSVVEIADEDLVDGAFLQNDGATEPGDSVSPDTASAEESGVTTTPASSTTTPTDVDNSTTGGTTTTGSDTGGSTTAGGATTGGSTTAGGEIDAMTGVITIGDETYAFPVEECLEEGGDTDVYGESVRDGIAFIVSLYISVIDLDDDGLPETTFDLYLLTDPDSDELAAEYSVVGVDSTTLSSGFEVDLSMTTDRITASGPIEDLNALAIPEGETRPMTLDIRCA